MLENTIRMSEPAGGKQIPIQKGKHESENVNIEHRIAERQHMNGNIPQNRYLVAKVFHIFSS